MTNKPCHKIALLENQDNCAYDCNNTLENRKLHTAMTNAKSMPNHTRRRVTIYNNAINCQHEETTQKQQSPNKEETEWINQFIQRILLKGVATTDTTSATALTIQRELEEIEKCEKLLAQEKLNKLTLLKKQLQTEREIEILSKIKLEKQEQLRKIRENNSKNNDLNLKIKARSSTLRHRPLPPVPSLDCASKEVKVTLKGNKVSCFKPVLSGKH